MTSVIYVKFPLAVAFLFNCGFYSRIYPIFNTAVVLEMNQKSNDELWQLIVVSAQW